MEKGSILGPGHFLFIKQNEYEFLDWVFAETMEVYSDQNLKKKGGGLFKVKWSVPDTGHASALNTYLSGITEKAMNICTLEYIRFSSQFSFLDQ